MAEKDTRKVVKPPPGSQPDCATNARDAELQDLLRQLDCPLDQSIVDGGLLRLANFVASGNNSPRN